MLRGPIEGVISDLLPAFASDDAVIGAPCDLSTPRESDPADSVLRPIWCKPEQFLRHPDRFACGQVDGGVARVACDEDFSLAKHLVIEAEGDLAQFGEAGT
jgi:hypothetical protein